MTTCQKHGYRTLFEAGRALQTMIESPDPRRRERNIHPWPRCHCFHLTSKSATPNKWTRRALKLRA